MQSLKNKFCLRRQKRRPKLIWPLTFRAIPYNLDSKPLTVKQIETIWEEARLDAFRNHIQQLYSQTELDIANSDINKVSGALPSTQIHKYIGGESNE